MAMMYKIAIEKIQQKIDRMKQNLANTSVDFLGNEVAITSTKISIEENYDGFRIEFTIFGDNKPLKTYHWLSEYDKSSVFLVRTITEHCGNGHTFVSNISRNLLVENLK